MTGALLALLLALSPGVQLADRVDARRGLLLVSDESGEAAPPPDQAMTREQLTAELRRIDEARPGLIGPVVFLATGALVTIPSAYLIPAGSRLRARAVYEESLEGLLMLGGGALLVTVGVVLILVGAIMLTIRLIIRAGNSREADEVRARINAMEQGAPPGPPPPPPPPPQAWLGAPGCLMTLLTFE